MTEEATPAKVRLTDGLGLAQRLRAPSMTDTTATHIDRMRMAADEIERLTGALKAANAQAERFERGWYLRGDVLERLQSWADAYPLTVFPEPDFKKAHAVLAANGMTLDAISASNMRHVINGVRTLVEEGLKA